MAARPIIRVGDGTSHGGTVLQGFPFYTVFGRHAAGMGHLVQCPQCKGAFPIIEGVSTFSIHGGHVAIEGMKSSCGATLIASQRTAMVDPGIGGIIRAPDAPMTLANGLAGSVAPQQGSLSNGLRRADCHHADTAIPLAEYIVREMKTNPFTPQGEKIAAANSYDPNARLAEWQQLPWYARVGRPPDFHATAAGQKAAAYAMWTERVAPGRPWDHKPVLKNMLLGKFNYGWQKHGEYDYFYDIWSNIHYGYVGVALGFSAAEMINGAGLAQALDDYWNDRPGHHHPQNGAWPASADDIPDHISIQLGTDLYSEVKPSALTTDILLQKLAAVPIPWGDGADGAKELHDCDRKPRKK